ncbi:TonB-dependent receptor [Psychrobium sp. 1_MG-2023]|uniref:TonB-dependent receptor n=1 Tax=Psychrobium sp. 1_MG-2023 TaxID=3062624 RepID=UPI000C3321D5|nr:TonB-dependent receptor [Psychrobium sp. 1_MG-2023]MDP2561838.1 TonB-dependent receptor [Psychrobium sp. 1_MG-2023]PKF55791.1 TonB-dependent receptor [Alteromonadales bacterium alter-6D02]
MNNFQQNKLTTTLIAILGLGVLNTAVAESKQNDSTITIGEVINVTTSKHVQKQTSLVGAIDIISRDQLQNQHTNVTVDLLKKTPGLYFSRFNQGIVSTDVAMRGFNAEGSMPHVKMLIDGIPSNLHVGLSEMDALFPMEVESIEIVKGNHDARYGLHNLAGNINLTSRRDDAKEIELLVGSFNTSEAQAYFGDVQDNFSQHYFVGTRKTDGYRDNSDLNKHTLSAKWFYQPSDTMELGLIARYFDYEADAPGYLTEQVAKQAPESSADYAAYDKGSKQTRHLSAHLNNQINDIWHVSAKVYWQQFDRHRYAQFTASSTQQERNEQDIHSGIILQASGELSPNWLLTLGLDYQSQENINQRFTTVKRVRQGNRRDWQFDYDNYGGFTQLQYRQGPLLISGGLRFDGFSGDLTDGIKGQTKRLNDNDITVQPKLNFLYDINDSLNFFANYGESFQAPIGSKAYVGPDNKHYKLSINTGVEAGFTWMPTSTATARLSVWQQDARNELTPKTDGSGDFENLGKTKREGWELSSYVDLNDSWTIFGSYAQQQAELLEPGEKQAASKGNTLAGVPDYTATLGLSYRVTDDFVISTFANKQQAYYVSNVYQERKYGAVDTVDLSLSYALDNMDLGLSVTNLFDTYQDYVYLLGQETIHSPSDGRAISANISYQF